MVTGIIGFLVLIILLMVRVPLGLAMGMVGFIGFGVTKGLFVETGVLDFNWKSLSLLVGRITLGVTRSYELSVIPLFILMGDFVSKGGLSRDLYRLAYAVFGHFRGGLSMSTIVACGGFSSICGSSLATTATMAKVAYPEMKKFNYDKRFASASISAGSTLGILIPPSVILIIYGLITEQSIRELFAAGLFPGLLSIVLYLIVVKLVMVRHPERGPAGEKFGWVDRWKALKNVFTTVLLFLIIMGGIYGGVFTPTEAAGIGAFGGFIIALFRRSLTFNSLLGLLKESAFTSSKLFVLLIGSSIFARFISSCGMVDDLTAFITELEVNRYMVILAIMLVYIILGMILESLSMILLTVPLFFPIVSTLGFDLVWFGILVVVVTEISLVTPPVGLNVFVMSSVIDDITPTEIFQGVTPFWISDVVRLVILMLIPEISLWLPQILY